MTVHWAASIGLLAFLWPAWAEAAEPSCAQGDVECGRQAFARGTECFDRHDYLTAASWFAAAANADAHPVVVFNLALTEARLESFISAATRFRALLAGDPLDPALRDRVQRELSAADAGIARVSFELPNPAGTRVTLDGAPVPSDLQDIPVDPGKHRLVVENEGDVVYDQVLDLTRGERLRLRVGSRTRAIDVVVVPSKTRAPVPVHPEPRSIAASAGPSPVWFYAAAAGTVVLGSLGVWSGLDTKSAYRDYRADLPELDQPEAERRVKDGHARERRTNMLFGATAIAAAGTTVLGLVVVDWSGPRRSSATFTVTPFGFSAASRF